MFNFLKEKLKETITKLSKNAEAQAKEEIQVIAPEEAEPCQKPKICREAQTVEPEGPVSAPKHGDEAPAKAKGAAGDKKAARQEHTEPEGKEARAQTHTAEHLPEAEPKDSVQQPEMAEKKGLFSRVFGRWKNEEVSPEAAAQTPAQEPDIAPSSKETDLSAPAKKTQAAEEQTPAPKAYDVPAKEDMPVLKAMPSKASLAYEKKAKAEKAAAAPAARVPASGIPSANKESAEDRSRKPAAPKEDVEPAKPARATPSAQPVLEDQPAEEKRARGFFSMIKEKVATKTLSESDFEEMFWDLEFALMENNVALEAIEKIKQDLRSTLVDVPIMRGQIESRIRQTLRKTISGMFAHSEDIATLARAKKPFVICFLGVNGSGKTTSIAKVARHLMDKGLTCCMAAGDTFRAAAIDQLALHGERLGVKVIKHEYGSDAAAVAFDAIEHAKAKGKDVVLIDTAGRLHSNLNLMDELHKIVRVSKPDLKIFVGESVTGNDCIEQARQFDEAVGIDGIILTKADVDEKGGAAISVSYVTSKPILYLGTGQEYEDFEQFDKDKLLEMIGL